MAARERGNELKVMLNDDEIRLLNQRCEMNHTNKSQVIRELIVFGFNYYVDYKNLIEVANQMSKIGSNINQIASRINATNSMFKSDIEDIRKEVDGLWRSLRSTLSGQVFKKR